MKEKFIHKLKVYIQNGINDSKRKNLLINVKNLHLNVTTEGNEEVFTFKLVERFTCNNPHP